MPLGHRVALEVARLVGAIRREPKVEETARLGRHVGAAAVPQPTVVNEGVTTTQQRRSVHCLEGSRCFLGTCERTWGKTGLGFFSGGLLVRKKQISNRNPGKTRILGLYNYSASLWISNF